MAEQKKLKILSLDGGGIRGLSSLEILKRIMYRVREEMGQPDLEPWQYFDLIGGTSTGGIIALMLGRLRMSVEECISEYADLGEHVFGRRQGKPHEAMFKASRLEAAIKSVVRKKLGEGNEDAPLLDPLGEDCCKTLVYTLPFLNPNFAHAKALRTYHSKHEPPMLCTIWQAARATSAAPTFFEPLVLGRTLHTTSWIDAGMKFNNPAREIRTEAGRIWGDMYGRLDSADSKGQIACFLSLGAGFSQIARMDAESIRQKVSAKFQVPLKAVEVMKTIVSDTETPHLDLQNELLYGSYYRFNVEQGLQEVQLFEFEKLETIVIDTDNYLSHRNREIIDCVAHMARLGAKDRPLAERSDGQEIFGSSGEKDETNLPARLKALRIDPKQFRKNEKRFEDSERYRVHFKNLGNALNLWYPIVQADLLDKEGRIIAEGLEKTSGLAKHLTGQSTSTLPSTADGDIESRVYRQTRAYERLREAFILYRQLLYATEVYFCSSSLEYCWVANRLGGVLEIFGLLKEALDLYTIAYNGRRMILKDSEDDTVEESRESVTRLREVLGAPNVSILQSETD